MEPVMRGLLSRGGFWVTALAVAALALPLFVSSSFTFDICIRVLLFAFRSDGTGNARASQPRRVLGHRARRGCARAAAFCVELVYFRHLHQGAAVRLPI